MELKELIDIRRSYRSLAPAEITEDLVRDLAHSASMAPSCFNNQPWRFVFAYDPAVLQQLFTAMDKGNEWTFKASLIVAVFSKPDLDCQSGDREYYLFDTGMGSAFLMLRAADLGLVAHPIAGFNPDTVKRILDIPEEMTLVTLINVGKKSDTVNPVLNETMAEIEKNRPPRKPFNEFAFINKYTSE
jgi:nitroreductase